jgi:hypothetical protein
MQYRVMKHITLALGRKIESVVHAEVGSKVRVAYEFSPELKKAPGAITVLHCGLQGRGGNAEREYERDQRGGERFRNPPIPLRARYLVSAWAPAPDDQELLGLVLRTFHDDRELETEGEEEQTVAYDGRPIVELQAPSFEEHKALAEALGMPLAPSVCYWVDFVIQSARVTPIKRVKERVIDFKKIDG